jgi:hypothetical protein
VLTGHKKPVTSLTFLAEGLHLASVAQENQVQIWDAHTGAPLAALWGATDYSSAHRSLLLAIGGISLGGSRRSGEAMGKALSAARTSTSLPTESAGRIAFQRLWPIGLFAIVAGGLAVLWPQVTGVGAVVHP